MLSEGKIMDKKSTISTIPIEAEPFICDLESRGHKDFRQTLEKASCRSLHFGREWETFFVFEDNTTTFSIYSDGSWILETPLQIIEGRIPYHRYSLVGPIKRQSHRDFPSEPQQ